VVGVHRHVDMSSSPGGHPSNFPEFQGACSLGGTVSHLLINCFKHFINWWNFRLRNWTTTFGNAIFDFGNVATKYDEMQRVSMPLTFSFLESFIKEKIFFYAEIPNKSRLLS
jgi:hypothetical protein